MRKIIQNATIQLKKSKTQLKYVKSLIIKKKTNKQKNTKAVFVHFNFLFGFSFVGLIIHHHCIGFVFWSTTIKFVVVLVSTPAL